MPREGVQIVAGRPAARDAAEAAVASVPVAASGDDRPVEQSASLRLHNDAPAVDACPVVDARIDDPGHDWQVSITLNGRDVTRDMTEHGGVVFNRELRLWPGAQHVFQVKVTGSGSVPARVQLAMHPHPSETGMVNGRVTLCLVPQPAGDAARLVASAR